MVTTTTVTIDRPETEIRGPNGDVFRLPRKQDAGDNVLVYKKTNSHLLNPSTGQRVRYQQRRSSTASGRPKTLGFGAAAITAFVGFRVCQLLVRCFRRPKQLSPEEEEELLIQQALEHQQMQQLPPVRVMPAMLQRALPKLGPPRRPKRLAEQQRSRTRAVPNARQKMQLQGVVQRKALTLEKWHAAVQRQAQALMVQQEQQQQQPGLPDMAAAATAAPLPCSRAAAVLPLAGAGSGLLVHGHPQPLL